jgi:hypothetical protein
MSISNKGSNNRDSRLCGVHTTYAVLAFFDDKYRNVGDILAEFPKVREEGISLKEIRDVLQKKGYCCKARKMTEAEIALGNKESAYVVLLENETSPHILMKRKISNEVIQIIDFPYITRKDNFDTQKNLTLVVARGDCGREFSSFWIIGLSFVLILIILLAIFRVRKREVEHEI